MLLAGEFTMKRLMPVLAGMTVAAIRKVAVQVRETLETERSLASAARELKVTRWLANVCLLQAPPGASVGHLPPPSPVGAPAWSCMVAMKATCGALSRLSLTLMQRTVCAESLSTWPHQVQAKSWSNAQ